MWIEPWRARANGTQQSAEINSTNMNAKQFGYLSIWLYTLVTDKQTDTMFSG